MTCDATWHRLEHAGYSADLVVWRSLAAKFGPAVTEVGAGCGRVSLPLASSGFEVTAIDSRRAYAEALRASAPPGLSLATVWGDPLFEADLIPVTSGLVIFPLLVAELICGEHGKTEGLTMIANSVPPTAAAALSVSGRGSSEGVRHQFDPPSLPKPYSYVSGMNLAGGSLELTHERVAGSTQMSVTESLVSITSQDLERSLGRPILDVKEIPAAEGVGASQVVVFDAS